MCEPCPLLNLEKSLATAHDCRKFTINIIAYLWFRITVRIMHKVHCLLTLTIQQRSPYVQNEFSVPIGEYTPKCSMCCWSMIFNYVATAFLHHYFDCHPSIIPHSLKTKLEVVIPMHPGACWFYPELNPDLPSLGSSWAGITYCFQCIFCKISLVVWYGFLVQFRRQTGK